MSTNCAHAFYHCCSFYFSRIYAPLSGIIFHRKNSPYYFLNVDMLLINGLSLLSENIILPK